jgi:hypothetical protein
LSHFYKPTIAGGRLTQFERPPFVWEQVRAVGLQAPRVWRNSGLSRSWPRDLSPRESGAGDPSRRTRWLVHAAEEKRVFRTDRHDDRRVDEAAGLAAGATEGRATRRRDTCIVGIAVLNANAVDVLALVPQRQRRRHQTGRSVLPLGRGPTLS